MALILIASLLALLFVGPVLIMLFVWGVEHEEIVHIERQRHTRP
jgi:hypothetical protein